MANLIAILEEPQKCVVILQTLGFKKSCNNNRLLYTDIGKEILTADYIIEIYQLQGISVKLFNLSCKQLLLRTSIEKALLIKEKRIMSKPKGVHVLQLVDTKSNQFKVDKGTLQLVWELLLLPNNKHCYGAKISGPNDIIYILNNNGTQFLKTNIDWNKLTIDDLCTNIAIVNGDETRISTNLLIEYCCKYNQIDYLQKVFYFLNKIIHDKDFTHTQKKNKTYPVSNIQYPKCLFETVIWQLEWLKNKKINGKNYGTLLNNYLHSQHIIDLAETISNAPEVLGDSFSMKNLCIYTENYVVNVIIRQIKDKIKKMQKLRKLKKLNNMNIPLQQQKWNCLLCNRIHDNTIDVCPTKHVHMYNNVQDTFRACASEHGLSLRCMNPFRYAINNESETFDVKKPFGIIKSNCHCANNNCTINFLTNLNLNINSISCEFGRYSLHERMTIIYYKNDALSIGELKEILFEYEGILHKNWNQMECQFMYFHKEHIFGNMLDEDLIISMDNTQHFKINYFNDLNRKFGVRKQYKILFSKETDHYKKCQKKLCPFVKQAKRVASIVPLCNDNELEYGCTYTDEEVLRHLEEYSHAIDTVPCLYQDKCRLYQNVLKDSMDKTIVDEIHLHLYHHPSRIGIMLKNEKAPFEYINSPDIALHMTHNYQILVCGVESASKIAYIVKEVIKNGFEQDLLPIKQNENKQEEKETISQNKINDEMVEYLNNVISQIQSKNTNNLESIEKNYMDYLSSKYEIFEKLNDKMEHSRHKKMGFPLEKYMMLTLLLYCNGKCNYDLSKSQRNGNVNKKWPYFDNYLNYTIDILSKYEIHKDNLYTGLCGIYYQFETKFGDSPHLHDRLHFIANVSFSTKLDVAGRFSSNEGLIIGLNMQRCYMALVKGFAACDVSWISKFPNECEVLCQRGSTLHVYRHKMTIKGKQQWLVCDEGNLQQTSFQAMFGA